MTLGLHTHTNIQTQKYNQNRERETQKVHIQIHPLSILSSSRIQNHTNFFYFSKFFCLFIASTTSTSNKIKPFRECQSKGSYLSQ